MSAETAFLETLKAAPADDTARLAYADWLDENARAQEAEYLRLVVALTCCCEDATREQPEVAGLLALANDLPLDWCKTAGARFMVVFYACTNAAKKAETIKLIREVTGKGLREAQTACEQTPSKLLACVPFEQAIAARDRIRDVTGTRILIHPYELPFITVYRVVAMCVVWDTRQKDQATAAFSEFLQAALSTTPDVARRLAAKHHVTLAENLELVDAQRRAKELNSHPHCARTSNGWVVWVQYSATGHRPVEYR
jgi:uncharacterized protein (TIGR02996 family)